MPEAPYANSVPLHQHRWRRNSGSSFHNESDAYSPAQIAKRVEEVGIAKAHLPFVKLFALGLVYWIIYGAMRRLGL